MGKICVFGKHPALEIRRIRKTDTAEIEVFGFPLSFDCQVESLPIFLCRIVQNAVAFAFVLTVKIFTATGIALQIIGIAIENFLIAHLSRLSFGHRLPPFEWLG